MAFTVQPSEWSLTRAVLRSRGSSTLWCKDRSGATSSAARVPPGGPTRPCGSPDAGRSGNVDYVRYLVQVEGRILGFEVDDEPCPYGGRELAAFCALGVEEALHPFGLETVHPAVESPFGGTPFGGTPFGHARPANLRRAYARADGLVARSCSGHSNSGSSLSHSSVCSALRRLLPLIFPPPMAVSWDGKDAM
jgi:hypothetical protein